MNVRSSGLVLICLVVVILISSSAFGADGLLDKNVHLFFPTVDGSGMITTYGTEPLKLAGLFYGIYVDGAFRPLDWTQRELIVDEQTQTERTVFGDRAGLISMQATGQLLFSVGLWDYVNVGIAIPYAFYRTFDSEFEDWQDATNTPDVARSAAFEDLRIDLKVIALNRQQHCIGVGLINTLTIPQYTKNQFTSDRGVTVAPRLVFDIGRGFFTYALNAGYKYYTVVKDDFTIFGEQEDELFEVYDELVFGTGGRFRLRYNQQILLDTAVRTLANNPFGDSNADYIEVMAAYRKNWIRLNSNILTIGAGVGIGEGVGTPIARAFIGFGRDEHRLHYMATYQQ